MLIMCFNSLDAAEAEGSVKEKAMYPPTVKLRDSSNKGAGAHLSAKVGDIAATEILYDKEEDFEEKKTQNNVGFASIF